MWLATCVVGYMCCRLHVWSATVYMCGRLHVWSATCVVSYMCGQLHRIDRNPRTSPWCMIEVVC